MPPPPVQTEIGRYRLLRKLATGGMAGPWALAHVNARRAALVQTERERAMEDLKRGVTSDARISTWGSYVSNGAGGSCFGKDIQSLLHTAREYGYSSKLLQATLDVNAAQRQMVIQRVRKLAVGVAKAWSDQQQEVAQ